LLLALMAGGAQALALALPWSGQPSAVLQMGSLALLVVLLNRCHLAWHGAAVGGLFALAWLAGTFWWLFISMYVYGGLAAPLAVLAVLGLCAFLSIYYTAASALYTALAARKLGWAWRAGLFAALWTLAELMRGCWFTGFPWGAGGYAQVDGAARWLAPWVGVYGIGAIVAWLMATLATPDRSPYMWRNGLLLGITAVLIWAPPPETEASSGLIEVQLLQGNIPQDEKFEAGSGIPMALHWYREQLLSSNVALVVAPETALPLLPQDLPAGYWDEIAAHFGAEKSASSRPRADAGAALIGIPLGNQRQGYTNSVLGLLPGQALPYAYHKHHLVPFGEFIPPLFRWFVELMNIPLGDFNAGAMGQASMAWRGQRLAPNICYEDLFGEELATRFADPAQSPTIFVNFSNIGWFGDSLAIDQHLNISRMRALEFARPMVRATNTGATAIIDHRGRVAQRLEPVTRGVLQGVVQGRGLSAENGGWGVTPYAWWASRAGLAPLWLACVLITLCALVLTVRRASGWPLGRAL
jgi:apolipoprotein N-acyltransferase